MSKGRNKILASSFDHVVAETINEVIKSVFDDELSMPILKHLEADSKAELGERVKTFADALPDVLGVGYVIIEDLILETLYSKCGVELERKKDYKFPEYLMDLNRQVRSKKKAWSKADLTEP